MKLPLVYIYFFILLLFSCNGLLSQIKTITPYSITAQYTDEKITIDGFDDELVWKNQLNVAENFYQNFPYDTAYAKSKTVVKMAYNKNNLFVFAQCYDTSTKNYVIQSLKRDWSYPRSDAFVVSIEPFNDFNNGFSFGVNPYGAQREGLIEVGGGGGVTTAWDNKWFASTNRTDSGWTAEFQIPLKSIRFNEKLDSWRVNFARNNLKINENSTWFPVPRVLNIAVLSHMGVLKFGASTPKKNGINAAFIPYVSQAVAKDYNAGTNTGFKFNTGFDAKIVLTSSLNLDLTVNPDFSQVEVDVQQINLTRFSLFFPERRQFFIENSDLFANFGFRQIRPFFSRRIGLDNGKITPILGGFRLSGKLGTKWRVGAMSMQTAAIEGKQNTTNYSVAAFQRSIFKSSNIAGILVNQFIPQMDTIPSYTNTLLGLDYNSISQDNKWRGKLFYHRSFDNGKTNAASVAHASWIYYNVQNWSAMWNHEYVGKEFNARVGFTPRLFIFDGEKKVTHKQSYWRLEPELRRRFYPRSKIINRIDISWYNSTYTDSSYQINDMVNNPYVYAVFQNSSTLTFGTKFYNTLLYYPIDISGKDSNLAAGRYHYQDMSIYFTSNNRKPFNFEIGTAIGSFYIGNKQTYSGSLNYRLQPNGIISIDYRREQINMPFPYKKTNLSLIGPKVEWAFSKKLFTTLFIQYNTQSENMNVNARVQWRFAPMSDLFIVFSDNYLPNTTTLFGNPNFPYLNVKNRALTIKLSYWLNS